MQSSARPSDDEYPGCETTLWQIGQWRCEYWRPQGPWRGSSLRLFREDRLVRTIDFGLRAMEQSRAWREAAIDRPNMIPADLVDRNDDDVPPSRPLAVPKNNRRK